MESVSTRIRNINEHCFNFPLNINQQRDGNGLVWSTTPPLVVVPK